MKAKALTDRIVESLADKRDGFIGSLKDETTLANSKGFRQGLSWAIDTIKTLERQADFEEIARIMMKHLNHRTDIYNPHHTVIISSSNAELVGGIRSTGQVLDYIKD